MKVAKWGTPKKYFKKRIFFSDIKMALTGSKIFASASKLEIENFLEKPAQPSPPNMMLP